MEVKQTQCHGFTLVASRDITQEDVYRAFEGIAKKEEGRVQQTALQYPVEVGYKAVRLDAESFEKGTKVITHLYARGGAPVFTSREVDAMKEIFENIGFKCSKRPQKKDLCYLVKDTLYSA
jgi:hypothetical protein